MERGCAPSAATAAGCATLDDRDDAGDLGPHARFRRYLLRPVQLDDGPAPILQIAAQVTAAPTRRGRLRSTALALSAIEDDLRGVIGGEVRAQALVQFGLGSRHDVHLLRHGASDLHVACQTSADEIFAGLRRSRRRGGPKPGTIAVQILLRQPAQVPRNRLALPPRTPASTIASRPARRTWATGSAAPSAAHARPRVATPTNRS